jgi:hypothetical protein
MMCLLTFVVGSIAVHDTDAHREIKTGHLIDLGREEDTV